MEKNQEKNQWVMDVARLSRISLSSSEVEKFSIQLKNILNYVAELNEVNTSSVLPISQVTGLTDIFAEDKVVDNKISYDMINKNAPEFKDGNFIVPEVFGE